MYSDNGLKLISVRLKGTLDDETRKLFYIAKDIRKQLTKTRFIEMLDKADLSVDDIDSLKSVISYHTSVALNPQQMKWLDEYSQQQAGRTHDNKEQLIRNRCDLPSDREIKYFARAVEAGLMRESNGGYTWLHKGGRKASLGYFIHEVFNPKGTEQIPYQRLEKLFNITRLDVALDQAINSKTPQKWRPEIDVLFKD